MAIDFSCAVVFNIKLGMGCRLRRFCVLENVAMLLSSTLRETWLYVLKAGSSPVILLRLLVRHCSEKFNLHQFPENNFSQPGRQEFARRDFQVRWCIITGRNCGLHVYASGLFFNSVFFDHPCRPSVFVPSGIGVFQLLSTLMQFDVGG